MAVSIYHYTSWDHLTVVQIPRLKEFSTAGSAVGWSWSGSAGNMVPGLLGSGQAIDAPVTLRFNYTAAQEDTAIVCVRFKPKAIGTLRELLSFNIGAVPHVRLRVKTSGVLEVIRSTTVLATGTFVLTAGTIYQIEMALWVNNVGAFQVRIDGVDQADLTADNVDTQNDSNENVNRIEMNNPDGVYDDFLIQKGSGGFATEDLLSTTVGEPFQATLYPSGVGFYADWNPSDASGADHFSYVDEENGMDDDTTFLSESVDLDKESWIVDTLPEGALVILDLSTMTALKGGGQAEGQHFVRIGGVDAFHSGATGEYGVNYEAVVRRWSTNPVSGGEWEPSDLATAEFGIRVEVSSGTLSITNAATVVLYTGLAPVPPRRSAGWLVDTCVHRFASLWRIDRADEVSLFLTDHNAALFFEGNTYTPLGGANPSARSHEANLREPNLEIIGALTSDKINADELRAGRYRDAKITEYLVDWMVPWIGDIRRYVYYVLNTRWNGREWVAQVSGIAHKLRAPTGDLYTRNCRYDLGDERCKVILLGLSFFSVNVVTVSNRRLFQVSSGDIPPSLPDGHFDFGRIEWLTNENVGLVSEIRHYISASRQFELMLPVPHDVIPTDEINVEPGCDKTYNGAVNGCLAYANQINFGGFRFMPGPDRLIEAPERRL